MLIGASNITLNAAILVCTCAERTQFLGTDDYIITHYSGVGIGVIKGPAEPYS